jgi:hypothetical protein
MQKIKTLALSIPLLILAHAVIITGAWAAGEYKVSFQQFSDSKAFYDDPRPVFTELSIKKVLPPEDYVQVTYNEEEMKTLWAEVTGFRSPEVVGKIAPEIKPGKYSYQDKEKYPGLKELMIPMNYERFRPGQPPLAGNFSEIEIIPTRQYYYSIPIGQATKKYTDATKQDENGYIIEDSYASGLPFPRPSGKFKAQQIMYNWEKRYLGSDNYYLISLGKGFNGKLVEDFDTTAIDWRIKLNARVIPPYGWYDERARKRGEQSIYLFQQLSPRDMYGNVINSTKFVGINDYDQFLVYIAMLRRIRKLSGTDTQDIAAGSDTIYEDYEGFSQKLSPTRFPYKYELLGEREYLVPSYSLDGSESISKSGVELANIKFERRPCYVVQLTQLEKGFIYGRRVIYIDAETFLWHRIENYDQKGRLYRDCDLVAGFRPEMGDYIFWLVTNLDQLDYHSTVGFGYQIPVLWLTRDHVSMQSIIKKGK